MKCLKEIYMNKSKFLILSLLLPLSVLANTTEVIDEPISTLRVKSHYNDFFVSGINLDTNQSSPTTMGIRLPNYFQDPEYGIFLITTWQPYEGIFSKNKNSYDYISVLAGRKASKEVATSLKSLMEEEKLSKNDIISTLQKAKWGYFPAELNFAFKADILITLPSNATYRCNNIFIAQGSSDGKNIWWMSGNKPNPYINQNGIPLYLHLPIIECENTASTGSQYLTGYIGSLEKDKTGNDTMVINYTLK